MSAANALFPSAFCANAGFFVGRGAFETGVRAAEMVQGGLREAVAASKNARL